ncbi:hypothetical protein L6R49_31510, partial [Myxococcota bacterium]|nr:hypothetical protein [Myxococcota bacterium]
VFAAAAAMVIITLLLMQIIHRITDAPAEAPEEQAAAEGAEPPAPAEEGAPEAVAEAPAAPAPPPVPEAESGLRISAVEPVKVRVEIDGVERYDAVLCASLDTTCEERVLKFPLAAEMAVEVADLTRLRVSYNGARVEPLGNLSASRRLVFIDDARR